MKGLLLAGVLLVLLAGGYYSRGFFFETRLDRSLYQYTLQFGDLDELHRFAPLIEARMQRLSVLVDVSLDPQFKGHQAIVSADRQKAASLGVTELPAVTISFKLAPGVVLGDAIVQIQDMERQVALPTTITSFIAKAPPAPNSR